MSEFEYEALLDRARERIPTEISERARWTLPEPQIMIEGANTIFRNFQEVVSHMDRDEDHVFHYMLMNWVPAEAVKAHGPASRVGFHQSV